MTKPADRTRRAAARRDPSAEIARRLRFAPVPGLHGISLYQAHPGSRLSRLAERSGAAPYWAFAWAGGLVLARYLADRPGLVRGHHVADLGTGSGLVAIAAAHAGAASVTAVDLDPMAVDAARLNAAGNGVAITVRARDALAGPPPEADTILAGDLFYDAALAVRSLAFLEACATAGRTVLVGDPGRRDLPRDRLQVAFEAEVPDFKRRGTVPAAVYRLR